MPVLVLGLLLWSGVHLFPAIAASRRKKLIQGMGLMPYKGVFALLILGAIVLMVAGWRTTQPVHVYSLPPWVNYITLVFVLVTFILFVAAQVPTNIRRFLRHPQLTGLMFWSIGHLLANGDSRSLVLFIGLFIWAKVQIICTNRRDGKRIVPERVPLKNDLLTVAGGIAVFIVFLFAHPYIAGVAIIP